jgi:RNA polymerase sigma-70 factor (ECF subfamily)
MATALENLSARTSHFSAAIALSLTDRKAIFEANQHRIYSLAFWMTGNELAAEELQKRVFLRAFRLFLPLDAAAIDSCLIAELRECMAIGELTLHCSPATAVHSVRRNTRRVDLEQAVIALPATEKLLFLLHDVEGNDCTQVARALRLSEHRCRAGLHQARLRIRELLAASCF